jgi:Arc/MetJ family transcription regulator
LVCNQRDFWCTVNVVTRITVDVNDEWLAAAQEVLGTDTKVSTINAALRAFALRRKATEIVAAFDSVTMDFTDYEHAWRYGGGRDLSRLVEEARESDAA